MISRALLIAAAAIALSGVSAKAQNYGEQSEDYQRPHEYQRPQEYEQPQEYERPRHREFPPELHGVHAACERGDREACVRFGWLMHEHRDRHEAWRRERPDYFWWDRR